MRGRVVTAVWVLGLVVTVVGADLLFFRHHVVARLLVNVGIVLVFAGFFMRYRQRVGV